MSQQEELLEKEEEQVIQPQEPLIVKTTKGRAPTEEELEKFAVAYQRNGRNATHAVMEVRPWLKDKYKIAGVTGTRWVQKLEIEKMDLVEAAKRVGINPIKIMTRVNDLLDSKKVTKTFTKDGDVHIVEEDNYNAIDKGLAHALKIGIGGGYKAEEIRQSGMVGHAHFSLGDLFEKARMKELEAQASMSSEEYKKRVDGLIAEAQGDYENTGQ